MRVGSEALFCLTAASGKVITVSIDNIGLVSFGTENKVETKGVGVGMPLPMRVGKSFLLAKQPHQI